MLKILNRIGCPPRLLTIVQLVHADMKDAVQFGDSDSEPFNIRSSVTQVCALAPTLFGIFVVMLKRVLGVFN